MGRVKKLESRIDELCKRIRKLEDAVPEYIHYDPNGTEYIDYLGVRAGKFTDIPMSRMIDEILDHMGVEVEITPEKKAGVVLKPKAKEKK